MLWRSATKPIRVEGEPVVKRKRHQELKDGVLHSHGDGQLHAHGDGGSCDKPDAEAEAAFREVLRSLVAAGKKNHAGVRAMLAHGSCTLHPRPLTDFFSEQLGANVFAYLVSIFVRTWVTVRLAMCAISPKLCCVSHTMRPSRFHLTTEPLQGDGCARRSFRVTSLVDVLPFPLQHGFVRPSHGCAQRGWKLSREEGRTLCPHHPFRSAQLQVRQTARREPGSIA